MCSYLSSNSVFILLLSYYTVKITCILLIFIAIVLPGPVIIRGGNVGLGQISSIVYDFRHSILSPFLLDQRERLYYNDQMKKSF